MLGMSAAALRDAIHACEGRGRYRGRYVGA